MPSRRKTPEGGANGRGTAKRRTAGRVAPRIVDIDLLHDRCGRILDAVGRRAYEIFEQRGGTPGSHDSDWLQAEAELLHPVPVEVASAGGYLIVRAEVPGLGPGEIEIGLEPRRVTIAGQRLADTADGQQRILHTAALAPRFFRGVELPEDVEPVAVAVTLTNGLLEVMLRKAGAPGAWGEN